MDGEGWTLALGELSTELMPTHFSESSRLTSLSYNLYLDRDTPLAHWEEVVPRDIRAFHIALDMILNIKTLSISSWIRAQFVKQDPYLRKIDIRERCRLRRLNFVGCANMGGVDLSSVVSSLVCEFDVWSNIGRVTIQGCKNLAYEDVMWIIGEEKLHYLD
ncbi:hypothetical protein SCHPADRAFT_944575 [Schizopora paradoxa]|uniref:F-box domain-containing protein n=1 Tax=Schizopora paradoxa TaxID=27342 RepID=A0A0H2RTY7_9AGAM|nr:hypothetical protein SCHPADRAFT_944575 [Schizopora paradoxa]